MDRSLKDICESILTEMQRRETSGQQEDPTIREAERQQALEILNKAMVDYQIYLFLEENGDKASVPALREAVVKVIDLEDKKSEKRRQKWQAKHPGKPNNQELKRIIKNKGKDEFKELRDSFPRAPKAPRSDEITMAIPDDPKSFVVPDMPIHYGIDTGEDFRIPDAQIQAIPVNPEYEDLPAPIKRAHPHQGWSYLSDREKRDLVFNESLPIDSEDD